MRVESVAPAPIHESREKTENITHTKRRLVIELETEQQQLEHTLKSSRNKLSEHFFSLAFSEAYEYEQFFLFH